MKKDVNGTVTLFIYNQSGQLIAEANGSGVIQREYAYYQNRPITLLAYGTTADVYYYHTDHLNTPQVMTDQAQGIVWEGDYEPFGEVDITTNAVENNLRFPGQYYDAETGSYYNYFRDYEPSLGRYLESDPIGLSGGMNTYVYVLNNTLRWTDPKGLIIPAIIGCAANPACASGVILIGGAGFAANNGLSSSSSMMGGSTSDTGLGGSDSANDGASEEQVICAMECDIGALQGMEDCINDGGVCEDDDMFQQCLDFVDRKYTNCLLRCQSL